LDAARARQRIVLDLMVKHGYIGDRDARLALAEPLHFVGQDPMGFRNPSGLQAPHFVTYVRNLLEAQYGAEVVNHGGLRVITTLDLDLQERAQAIVQYNVSELARRTREEGAPDYNLHDAALVAIKPDTGEILAMVGSADYTDASIDGAVNVALANRQPGSAIKPITYAAAFAHGLTPATVISDVPTTFLTKENEPYAPENYDHAWHGPISLRTALATSSNMVAVKVLDHVGIDSMVETAKALGISTFDDPDRFGLALTLGGGEVKLLELTTAYAAFANGGKRVEPVAIRSVVSSQSSAASSQISSDWQLATGDSRQAVSPQVAYLITDILSDDSARIPAFGEDSVLHLSRPAAAKTGTTTDFRDNWTVGYTPDLAVGVWAGNADNEPMYKVSGITGAAPIWHDFMEEALKGTSPHDFPRPDGIVQMGICETSGLLPNEYCPRRRTEVFIKGTEPTRYDDTYRPIALDSATGLLWTNGCYGQRVERVYRLFPPDASDWARKQGIPEPPPENCLGQLVGIEQAGGAKTAGAQNKGAQHVEDAQSAANGAALLQITSPAPNSIFELSPQLPPELQQIEVSARLGTSTGMRELTLLVDSQPIATFTAAPYRALWRLAPGEHQVQAAGEDANGQRVESAVIRFTVTNRE
jgi:membrane carboxypeptidase/penicillin-binding protein